MSEVHCSDVSDKQPQGKADESHSFAAATADGVRDVFSEYSSHATIHGVSQLGGPRIYSHRKFVWLVLLIGMAISLGTIVFNQFIRLSSWPTVTDIHVTFADRLEFPAVTICNLNQFHQTRVPNNSIIKDLIFQLSELDDLINLNFVYTNISEDASQHDVSGDEVKEFALTSAHTVDELFRQCFWQTKRVNCSAVFSATVTSFGVCYTFNGNVSAIRGCRNPGPWGGLRVILNIQQDEYYFSKTFQAGIKVVLHRTSEMPFPAVDGVWVGPGVSASISVTRHSKVLLPPPYKAFGSKMCVDTESTSFRTPLVRYPNYDYTKLSCKRECLIDKLVEICGCRMFFDPGNDTICSAMKTMNCYLRANSNLTMTDFENCSCPGSCRQVKYLPFLSQASFASDFLAYKLMQENIINTSDFLSRNFIELRIFYEVLLDTDVIQRPELTYLDILGTLGGHMGLCLGASILSVSELIEICIVIIARMISRLRK